MDLHEVPTEAATGVRLWKNLQNAYTVMLLHFTADPETADTKDSPEKVGISVEKYRREYDLDFSSWAGKPVFPEFNKDKHVQPVYFTPSIPVWRGWDFGYHHPAVTYTQILQDGQWWVLGEVIGEDQTLERFIDETVLPYESKYFPEAKYIDSADPAGRQVSGNSEYTSFTILAQRGIFPYNKRTEIQEGLTIIHKKLLLDQLRLSPNCKDLQEAFSGGYRYPDATPGTPEPKQPLKDGYFEHLMDALRYNAVNAYSLWEKKPPAPKKEPTREDQLIASHKRGFMNEFEELNG